MTPDEPRNSFFSLFFTPELGAWQGQVALPIVFWGSGVAMSMALAVLYANALDAGQLAFQQVLVLVSAAYTVWILVAIWRCAQNASPFWGTLARWPTVAWGLNSALVLFFLQIQLMPRYARG